VDIGACVGTSSDKIWTLSMNTESKEVPIVLLHGFGAAMCFWVLNLDTFASERPLYAIDLLGFGKSSRPKFSNDAKEVEIQYVNSIEKWRHSMKIDRMILLGHSFGAFLSTAYAMRYPERIEHLVLAGKKPKYFTLLKTFFVNKFVLDPWGMIPLPQEFHKYSLYKRSMMFLTSKISPLFIIRLAGPALGPTILRKSRPDIVEKYEHVVEKHDKTIAKYVYHCNSRKHTGEYAFRDLLDTGVYPKHPMCERLQDELCESVPLTCIFGADSWLDNSFGPTIKQLRPNSAYTHIEYIESAGHQLFSDNALEFNRLVMEACQILKSNINNVN
jgi:abhydrolase domain-containing protein 5